MGRCADEGISKDFMHDACYFILLCKRAVDLGGDDDRVRRGDKGVLHDSFTDVAQGYFGCECFAVVNERFDLPIVDINCADIRYDSCDSDLVEI